MITFDPDRQTEPIPDHSKPKRWQTENCPSSKEISLLPIALEMGPRPLLTTRRPDKHVDSAQSPAVARIIHPAPFERKIFGTKVRNRRRKRELPIEPQFDRMPVRRDDVHAASCQRPLLRREQILSHKLTLIARVYQKRRRHQCAKGHCSGIEIGLV
jgi:hypothetical protein